MRLLDPTHARVLQLADEGVHNDGIAAQLSLDPAAVRPVLQVARAKLAALEALDDPTDDNRQPTAITTPVIGERRDDE
jgi:hypothetical protein